MDKETLIGCWTSEENFWVHVESHKHEEGFETPTKYGKSAYNSAKGNERGIKALKKPDGTIYLYNPNSKTITMISSDGKIITHFHRGIEYLEGQRTPGDVYIDYYDR
ncbi:MAG: hypothetical protein FWD58_09980 [Firmicutes bacterium]|nr:hypothetical protein [Bacillota bacterium]